jgi:hypothetical protein
MFRGCSAPSGVFQRVPEPQGAQWLAPMFRTIDVLLKINMEVVLAHVG